MSKPVVFLSFSLRESSVSDYFLSLSLQFISNGYEVVIFSDLRKLPSIEIHQKVILKYLSLKNSTRLEVAKFVYKQFKYYKPVLTISVFSSVNLFVLIGYLLGVKNRVAWIRTLSSQFPQKLYLIRRKRLIYKFATCIIANSEATRLDALNVYGIRWDKLKVLPNSVADNNDSIEETKSEILKIVYVGRLYETKGVDILIKAFDLVLVDYPDCKLEIIGSGENLGKLKELVIKQENQNSVFFRGNVSKKNVLKAFKASYIAVVPSKTEAFGYTVIEAMSMKTLVIGANNTGIKEIIIDNKTGLLFETDDIEDLAEKIKSVLKDKIKRNHLAECGYEHFLNNYENANAVIRDFKYFNALVNHA
ncbi:glycosyltransferase family 4 protein [Tamlana sp. s12]|uniref:glycosyltransferase family 4 protein n=1 Tax=Tamlana sp. s12 TaxID=1630406 RepID=UPI000800C487|nr:glycosyltransferase family 4 protein [Tamlana sp. s12]OBQ55381.1 hypothetical protein VQ01_07860 [Tamlana sp. s12]QQY80939.1 glycosyltransferase family 4 protein [Tamlana sp. s12]